MQTKNKDYDLPRDRLETRTHTLQDRFLNTAPGQQITTIGCHEVLNEKCVEKMTQ